MKDSQRKSSESQNNNAKVQLNNKNSNDYKVALKHVCISSQAVVGRVKCKKGKMLPTCD